ncbi:hypothetical protein Moror_13347 [Moniliophthora roreri MCA 2997]|uniref:Uncharacterized protein n=1 Tax=Moniliophthora roreri (strain MCA 2997) TaxID=1381753 RepID=V2WWK7_MONRO|nr:hypothetical protein Moror_13347 [Moniliophthora roreri MCA 2997]
MQTSDAMVISAARLVAMQVVEHRRAGRECQQVELGHGGSWFNYQEPDVWTCWQDLAAGTHEKVTGAPSSWASAKVTSITISKLIFCYAYCLKGSFRIKLGHFSRCPGRVVFGCLEPVIRPEARILQIHRSRARHPL